jgi:hypothetical protein
MATAAFDSVLEEREGILVGPWRSPRQMLHAQTYGNHATIHDEDTARRLGFRSGTIEGPTHFSQFIPLLDHVWGRAWHETGGISVHFQSPAFDGDRLRAFVRKPEAGDRLARIWMERADGATLFTGTASVGADAGPSELDTRLARLAPAQERIILKDLEIGMKLARRPVIMPFDHARGALYPFTLEDKLAVITEPCDWYLPDGGVKSPWGRPIVPFEMISVLLKYTDEDPPFPIPDSAINLIADQEIRLLEGPVFVDEPYEIEQEIVAFSGSRRTESVWIRTSLFAPATVRPLAVMLINQASLKESHPGT